MSGDAAASTLVEIKIKQLERDGKKLSTPNEKNCTNPRAPRTNTRPIRAMLLPVCG